MTGLTGQYSQSRAAGELVSSELASPRLGERGQGHNEAIFLLQIQKVDMSSHSSWSPKYWSRKNRTLYVLQFEQCFTESKLTVGLVG